MHILIIEEFYTLTLLLHYYNKLPFILKDLILTHTQLSWYVIRSCTLITALFTIRSLLHSELVRQTTLSPPEFHRHYSLLHSEALVPTISSAREIFICIIRSCALKHYENNTPTLNYYY